MTYRDIIAESGEVELPESIAEFNRVLVCPKGHLVDAPQHDACVPVATVDDWDC